ncbi:MAG: 1-deoxy-D-xylulose-5-phosphate reductoisomerase [Armatimonadetes bacterium]|nr:1-deoxy-D-xylulose-5-phosphate reductoisomerase [Armatimonadota bacterium]
MADAPSPRRVVVIGATGSIGRSTLCVIDDNRGALRAAGLAAHRNARLLADLAVRYRPDAIALTDAAAIDEFRARAGAWQGEIFVGEAAAEDLARAVDAEVVVLGSVGLSGLRPGLAAIDAGRDVALASKEVLVVAGAVVMARARARGVRVLPVDSEHSAIAQCLAGGSIADVARLILTASGGPFLRSSLDALATVTAEQALAHPTWRMGPKVTVDSATLMNKGFEVIEARWLFDVSPSKIQVMIHPQSVVHSMVEFADGATLAQLSPPDMRLPIQLALLPDTRQPVAPTRMDWTVPRTLTFEPPDLRRFPCLAQAYDAIAIGGTMPAVLEGADASAVALFLDGQLPFTEIPKAIRTAMDFHRPIAEPSLEELLAARRWAYQLIRSL